MKQNIYSIMENNVNQKTNQKRLNNPCKTYEKKTFCDILLHNLRICCKSAGV